MSIDAGDIVRLLPVHEIPNCDEGMLSIVAYLRSCYSVVAAIDHGSAVFYEAQAKQRSLALELHRASCRNCRQV